MSKPLPYPWLPADDAANVQNVPYMPTPEQIAQATRAILDRDHNRRKARHVDPMHNSLAPAYRRKRGIP